MRNKLAATADLQAAQIDANLSWASFRAVALRIVKFSNPTDNTVQEFFIITFFFNLALYAHLFKIILINVSAG